MVLLHFQDWVGTEIRFRTEPASITLNAAPHLCTVQSFVPPNQPETAEFQGEQLIKEVKNQDGRWEPSTTWYILDGVRVGKIYNEYGGVVGVNIASHAPIIERERRSWSKQMGTYDGEPIYYEPKAVFVE